MNKAATIAVAIAAGVLLIPPTASAGKAEQFEQVFSHYDSIRMALAADSVEGIPYLGETRGRCGEVLQFPQSHWSPGRSPTQSATGDPSGRSG